MILQLWIGSCLWVIRRSEAAQGLAYRSLGQQATIQPHFSSASQVSVSPRPPGEHSRQGLQGASWPRTRTHQAMAATSVRRLVAKDLGHPFTIFSDGGAAVLTRTSLTLGRCLC